MAETRGERAHRRAINRVNTEPVINTNPCRRTRAASPEHAAEEEEASSLHPSRQLQPSDGRSASASSHGCHDQPTPQAALLMPQELLWYRPAEAGHDGWLARITELVNAAGAAPAPSRSMAPPPSRGAQAPPPSHCAQAAHGAPAPPPPPLGDGAGHRHGTRVPEGAPLPSHGASSLHLGGPSCQILQRAPEDARVSLERQRQHRAVQDIAAAGRNNHVVPTNGVMYSRGCLALTRELRRVA